MDSKTRKQYRYRRARAAPRPAKCAQPVPVGVSDGRHEHGSRFVHVTFDAQTLLAMLLKSRTDRSIISWTVE